MWLTSKSVAGFEDRNRSRRPLRAKRKKRHCASSKGPFAPSNVTELSEESMGSNDVELIQRWRLGDARAFEELVRRWQKPVARFIARMAGWQGHVEDLCQEVFLRVYRAGPQYQQRAAFSTWL